MILYLKAPSGYDHRSAILSAVFSLGGRTLDVGELDGAAGKSLTGWDGKPGRGSTIRIQLPAGGEKELLARFEATPMKVLRRDTAPGRDGRPERPVQLLIHIRTAGKSPSRPDSDK